MSDDINYGTHGLPKKFWTSGKAGILKDPVVRAVRAAKSLRHTQNKAAAAERNRERSSKQKRGG